MKPYRLKKNTHTWEKWNEKTGVYEDTGQALLVENMAPYIDPQTGNWMIYDPMTALHICSGVRAQGLSAYEIAVKHGFVGTEAAWAAAYGGNS